MAATWDQLSTYTWDQLTGTWDDPRPGRAFATNVFGANARALLEIAPNADLTQLPSAWTFYDVTADMREASGFAITKGRPNFSGQAQPSTGKAVLGNKAGDYTTRRAMSKYFPGMRRDMPMRLGLDTGTGYVERWSGFADTIIASYSDNSARDPIATISGSGLLRHLGQGDAPIRSPLTRSILGNQSLGLVRFWPCEDGNGADGAASGLAGQVPLKPSGVVAFGTVNYAVGTGSITLLPGVTFGFGLMPQFLSGGSLSASFPAGSSSAWTVQAIAYVDPITNDAPLVLFQWTEGGRTWQVVSNGISIDSVSLLVNGTAVCTEPHILIGEEIRIDVAQSGPDISVSFKPMLGHAAQTATILASTLSGVSGFSINPNKTAVNGMFSVGEVRIWDGNAAPTFKTSIGLASAWDGYPGETVDARLARLCAEENIPITITGTSTIAMGVQPQDTRLNILRMCEATDQGVLSDGINFGLAYTCFTSRVNASVAMALDVSSGDLASPILPVDDDHTPANDVTYQQGVTLNGSATGSSARATDDASIAAHGATTNTVTVNTQTSAPLLGMANWDVHLANVDIERYPSLDINLIASPNRAAAWLTAVEGERVTVDNLPAQSSDGDVDVLIEGWSEYISVVDWTAKLNTSPAQPWRVVVVDDATRGRIGVTDCTLAADITTTTATTFTVSSPTAPWTTAAGAYPQDINIGGERMTLTAVTGATSPQTFTVTRSVNGVTKTHKSGDAVDIWAPNYVGR